MKKVWFDETWADIYPEPERCKVRKLKKAIVNNAPKHCWRYYLISKCEKNVLIINAPL